MGESLTDRIGALHAEAVAHGDLKMAAICLVALGESDSNPAWGLPSLSDRQSLATMSQEDAVRMCVAAMEYAASQNSEIESWAQQIKEDSDG
jgi:hypothetical protein